MTPLRSGPSWMKEILQALKPQERARAFVGHGTGRQRHEVGLACAAEAFKHTMKCPLCREHLAPPSELVVYGKRSPLGKKADKKKAKKEAVDFTGMPLEQFKKLKVGPVPLSVFLSLKFSDEEDS